MATGRRAAADRLGVGARTIPAHQLDAGMGAQHRLEGVGLAVGQNVDMLGFQPRGAQWRGDDGDQDEIIYPAR